MVIYSLMFFLCVLLSFFAERKRRAVALDTGETVVRPAPFLVVLSSIPLVFFTGMRGNMADTTLYIRVFEGLTWDDTKDALLNFGDNKDVGFTLFSYVIKQIWDNYTFWLFVIAIFCVFCIWKKFYEYSDSITFSIFLFFGTATFTWLFNGMRQYIAVAGMFAMFPLLLKTENRKKNIKRCVLFIIGALVLSTIHMTALIILPIFFLCRGEILGRLQFAFILLFVGASSLINPLTSLIDTIFSDTQYSGLTSDIEMYEEANILRLLVLLIPIFLGLYRIKVLRQMNDPVMNFSYNMSLLNASLMVPAVLISGNVFARFAEYCNTFNLILYPMLINRLYSGKTRRVLYLLVILMYLIWFIYQVGIVNNGDYSSSYF